MANIHTQNQMDSLVFYIENYLDLVENVPNNLARIMTRIHEFDIRRTKITKLLDVCLKKYFKKDFTENNKLDMLNNIQNFLIELQDLSDSKICCVQTIYDMLDIKARQLETDFRIANSAINISTQSHPSSGNNSNSYSNSNGNVTSSGRGPNSSSNQTSFNSRFENNANGRNSPASAKENSKDLNSSNSNGNSKRTSRRSHGAKNNQDSNGGSGDDRSSTPVTTERASSGKRANKRGIKSGQKAEAKRNKNSYNYNDSPPTIYDDSMIDPDEPTYCLCEQISYGEMICCDNANCKIEWFHFSCVSLTTKPKGRWYCPKCRGERSNIQRK